MDFKTINDLDVSGKKVLLRADLNVPVADGSVTDATRIKRLKPTIDKLIKERAKIIVLSHFGRPKGKVNPEFSLEFLTSVLEKNWETPVTFANNCIGESAQNAVNNLQDGHILLLENVRFHEGEETNDPAFSNELAKLGDLFINDAFSAAHRAHASTEGIAHLLPSGAGLLMEAELNALHDALESPEKPVAALVGGAKVSTKLSVLNNLVKKVDYLILGGGMANTFILAQGKSVGNSLCEPDMVETANQIFETAKAHNCEIVLPIDTVVVEELSAGSPYQEATFDAFPENMGTVDTGVKSIENVNKILSSCKTLLWNGPMGVFEIPPFDRGTNAVAQHAAKLTQDGQLVSVAGGGDTVSALKNAGVDNDFTYVSSAGGAFLEWIEGKTLPGVAALLEAKQKAA